MFTQISEVQISFYVYLHLKQCLSCVCVIFNCNLYCCFLQLSRTSFFKIYFTNLQTGKLLKESEKETGHQKPITSLSKSSDWSHFITGSLDKSAKVVSQNFSFIFFVLNVRTELRCLPFSYCFLSSLQFCQLWDSRTLTLIKTYVTERPVNACDISPLLDHVCIKQLFLFCFVASVGDSYGSFNM